MKPPSIYPIIHPWYKGGSPILFRWETCMSMTTTATAPNLVISPEVVAFARERKVDQYLAPILDLFRRLFGDARKLAVGLHDDPEIAGLRSIVFEVEVPWPNYSQARDAYRAWHDGLFAVFPSQHLCDIALLIHRVDE